VKTFDVAIIGGGVIGASIAFELAREKMRVAVFDRQEPGREASWAAAGMLSPAPDSPRDFPLAPVARESLRMYPQFVASVEADSGESTAFACEGTLEVFFGLDADANCDRRVSECRRLGIRAEAISVATARNWEPALGDNARAVAWLADECTVEPRALTGAVVGAARRRQAEILRDCAVTELICEKTHCTGVVAGGERISAGHVVLAAGCFSRQLMEGSSLLSRLAPTRPVRGQLLALRPRSASLRRVLRSDHGYLVPRRDGRIVAGSTSEDAGFEKRVTPEGLQKIFAAALELFPELRDADLVETWSGLRPGTPDDLPILGPSGIDGLLTATGHYRNGILLAPITAKLMRDWIVEGRANFDAAVFSPLRFTKEKLGLAR
jgi:glycine oxidase